MLIFIIKTVINTTEFGYYKNKIEPLSNLYIIIEIFFHRFIMGYGH